MQSKVLTATILTAALLFVPGPGAVAGSQQDREALEAVALYDAGNYEEAGKLLRAIDDQGRATGPLLYRLAFCLGKSGETVQQRAVEIRALNTLEQEYETNPGLEVAFYLANTLRNRNRQADAVVVAKVATDALETGEWPKAKSGLDRFRVAKLYADQDRFEEAARWYLEALKKLDRKPDLHPNYINWARRYLADSAFGSADYKLAAESYAALTDTDDPPVADLDRLASSLVRIGAYAEAVEAWRRAEKADPARGDRPRYCWRLAAMAESLGKLPESAPSGERFDAMDKAALETLMKEQSQLVREARESAATSESITAEKRAELQGVIDAARPVFTAAALEYALRDLPIRETAFFGGYAPLIFHTDHWRVPEAGKR